MSGAAEVLDSPTPASKLVDRVLTGDERAAAVERAGGLRRLRLDAVALSDLDCIANGVFSPLNGFLGERDYRAVVSDMRLGDGAPWSMPITLAVDHEAAADLREGEELALHDEHDQLVGLLHLTDRYRYDKAFEAKSVYRTEDAAHPGVARLYAQPDVLLGGDVVLLARSSSATPAPFAEHKLTPAQTRAAFAERGWRTVVGFQTRNPIHRAHEYLQKCALEIVDGLLVHPLVGATKGDDVPADVRMRCYEALFEGYYPKDRAMVSVFPAAMRYAGPREAIWHAICRKNYGCTHFIVGRDHAGVGSYYG